MTTGQEQPEESIMVQPGNDQQDCPTNDATAVASEISPELEASSQTSQDDGDSICSSTSDVEKGAVPKPGGEVDSDTDDTVVFEDDDAYPEWVPVWFLNHGWMGVLAICIPILFVITLSSIMGHVFSDNKSSDVQENIASNVDLSLISTTPPSAAATSLAPTVTPTTSSLPSVAPSTLVPSASPSSSPSHNPTTAPTVEPIVSHDFMVRLYWHPEFYWQETYDETWWCMECAECQKFVLGDGWQGECVSPGPTPDSCQEGDQIWVRHCKDESRRYTFEVVKNFGSGDQVRVHGTSLCFSIIDNTYLELRTCDPTKPEQLFAPIDDTMKFELRPYDQMDWSDKDANCLSQRHHPKDKELVGMFRCRTNINHETNYWTEYYR